MPRPIIATIVLVGLLQMGCSPEFNWRETNLSPTPLHALFPCKPDKTVRNVEMAGRPMDLHMTSCTTAGVTTAVGHAGMLSADSSGSVLQQWRLATLKSMAAGEVVERPLLLSGIRAEPAAVLVQARGKGPQGRPLELRAAWFSRDSIAYVALVFGEQLRPDVAETFLAGLRLQ